MSVRLIKGCPQLEGYVLLGLEISLHRYFLALGLEEECPGGVLREPVDIEDVPLGVFRVDGQSSQKGLQLAEIGLDCLGGELPVHQGVGLDLVGQRLRDVDAALFH